jgi:DNA-binding transcriptional MocR family regulator
MSADPRRASLPSAGSTGRGAAEVAALAGPPAPATPAYAWLADRLRAVILDGRLLVGDRLPSERSLAAALQLSRVTVSAAYTLLRADGYLASHQGSRARITMPGRPAERPDTLASQAPTGSIDLTVAALPAPQLLATLAAEAAARLPPLLAGHGLHPLGLPELRAAVAGRLTARGLPTAAEQVLITQGALHGWDLLLRALTRPGDTVLIEQPSYPSVLDAARSRALRVQPLAVTEAGWTHARSRRGSPPVLAHVTADYQNPTGLCAGVAQRQALLAGLSGTTVVADETFTELSFAGPSGAPAPLAALDRTGSTITVGSLSKCVWPGLRVGWIRAHPALIRRIGLLRAGQDLATPVLEQLLALACLARLEEIVTGTRATLLEHRDKLAGLLREQAPDWQFTLPDGGMNLWIDLGEQSSTQLTLDARAAGVLAIPGPRFSATGTHEHFLRLPYCLPGPVLARAVGILRGIPARPLTRRPDPARTWTA